MLLLLPTLRSARHFGCCCCGASAYATLLPLVLQLPLLPLPLLLLLPTLRSARHLSSASLSNASGWSKLYAAAASTQRQVNTRLTDTAFKDGHTLNHAEDAAAGCCRGWQGWYCYAAANSTPSNKASTKCCLTAQAGADELAVVPAQYSPTAAADVC
jgi:hypothetical protein